jgi:hypothetical protein
MSFAPPAPKQHHRAGDLVDPQNHCSIIALICADFSPIAAHLFAQVDGIQSMKAGLNVGRSLTRSNQFSTCGSRPLLRPFAKGPS